jgi:hypothetical protein
VVCVGNLSDLRNQDLVEERSEVFLSLEDVQELASHVDSLACLPDHVGFNKRFEVQLLQDKRAEVVIRLYDLLQEDHYAHAQLEVEMSIISDSYDLLVDY